MSKSDFHTITELTFIIGESFSILCFQCYSEYNTQVDTCKTPLLIYLIISFQLKFFSKI